MITHAGSLLDRNVELIQQIRQACTASAACATPPLATHRDVGGPRSPASSRSPNAPPYAQRRAQNEASFRVEENAELLGILRANIGQVDSGCARSAPSPALSRPAAHCSLFAHTTPHRPLRAVRRGCGDRRAKKAADSPLRAPCPAARQPRGAAGVCAAAAAAGEAQHGVGRGAAARGGARSACAAPAVGRSSAQRLTVGGRGGGGRPLAGMLLGALLLVQRLGADHSDRTAKRCKSR